MKQKHRNKMKKIILTLSFCLAGLSLQAQTFNITSIYDILPQHPEIEYIKVHDVTPFEYEPFPLSRFPELQPNNGLFAETFILKIPNGQVCSRDAWIKIEDNIVAECIPPYFSFNWQMNFFKETPFKNLQKVNGRVAVITMFLETMYSHWLYNVLGRLAMLEMQGIEYDWLYVTDFKPFMKETLALWGVDPAKIIQPFNEGHYIQADELIVPSHIGKRTPQEGQHYLHWVPLDRLCPQWGLNLRDTRIYGNLIDSTKDICPSDIPVDHLFLNWTPLRGNYFCRWVIDYIASKFLPHVQNKHFDLSDKIFISRKKARFRKMTNEDEVFALFEPLGFVRYNLEDFSILEQVALFHQAKAIVAAHGTGFVNLMFTQPGTTVVEIFQERSDCCFYDLALMQKLNYYCIKTIDFNYIDGGYDTNVPLSIIQDFIDKTPNL